MDLKAASDLFATLRDDLLIGRIVQKDSEGCTVAFAKKWQSKHEEKAIIPIVRLCIVKAEKEDYFVEFSLGFKIDEDGKYGPHYDPFYPERITHSKEAMQRALITKHLEDDPDLTGVNVD